KRFSDLIVVFTPGVVEERDYCGARHAFKFCDSSQSRLTSHVNDFLAQPLKTLVMGRLIGKYICRGLQLECPEFLESTPDFHALARPRTGQIKQEEKPRARRCA